MSGGETDVVPREPSSPAMMKVDAYFEMIDTNFLADAKRAGLEPDDATSFEFMVVEQNDAHTYGVFSVLRLQ